MTTQHEYAEQFASLHQKGNPLILFNGWDAGSAVALQEVGSKAIATGSWSVGQAHGCGDAEGVPLEDVIVNLKRIMSSVELPVTLDFEGGYAEESAPLKQNISKVIDAGAVGINFEDQVVGTGTIYAQDVQSARIEVIREAANEKNLPFFINARTDLFLKNEPGEHNDHMEEAIARSHAYANAGASGFFAPGLGDPDLIKKLCDASPIPVNIMIQPHVPTPKELAALGVARISYGGGPYYLAMEYFKKAATKAISLNLGND
jgi:2-methylisocitrate lyase-like PEP mutase family enzyme